jgi:hypothetical protein
MSASRGYFTCLPKMHSPEMKVFYGILPLQRVWCTAKPTIIGGRRD